MRTMRAKGPASIRSPLQAALRRSCGAGVYWSAFREAGLTHPDEMQ